MSSEHEHSGMRHSMDKMTDVAGGTAGKMKASMVNSADTFVENAAIGDMYEIAAARIALQRSTSPQIKSLAKQMIADHTTNTHQLKAALEMSETRGVASPPMSMDTRREKMIEHLEAAPADKFDSTYISQQVLAHEETVSLLSSYRDKGDNPQLRSLAAGGLPVVERHLHHAKMLASA